MSAAPDPPAYLAGRHASQVLAAHQAMARIRQAMMRPDLAASLLRDALDVLEVAAAPVRPPRSAPGAGQSSCSREREREYHRERRARLKDTSD